MLPTFHYGIPGVFPQVRFTVCCHDPISPGEELCIPYVDVSAPRALRKSWLRNSYYFDSYCDCKRCTIPIVTDDDEEDSKDIKLDLIKTFSVIQHEQNFASIEKTFQNSSWFYQESGERYLQSLLDSIDPRSNYQNQMVTCQKALELASKLILSMRKKNVGWRILRFCLLKYKCAKLRLFLQFDDPVVAIQDLQECLEHYQVFYDESHEFLQDLQETL
jgi:hypothetical protein